MENPRSSGYAITCHECGGTEFRVQDGVSVCQRCEMVSREHGMDTMLEEESLGAFGSTASTLKKK